MCMCEGHVLYDVVAYFPFDCSKGVCVSLMLIPDLVLVS
jgi:hypothetical protein